MNEQFVGINRDGVTLMNEGNDTAYKSFRCYVTNDHTPSST